MRLDQADRIMLGDREVSRVYLGTNLVWTSEFSPVSLFAQGEPGVWYDPSDFSTMFQDAAGTVPVTAVEQPVGRILDKSGRGFHATQATATSRPVLRQDGSGKHYLYFDGVDDGLVTNTITPGTDKVQVFAGVRRIANRGVALEFSVATFANDGSFFIYAGDRGSAAGPYWTVGSRGSVAANVTQDVQSPASYNAPLTNVITSNHNIIDDRTFLRINGSQIGAATGDKGTGNFLAYPLYIGRRGGTTLPYNGHLYSLIVRFGSNLPTATIEQTENYVNQKTGAY